MNLRTITAMLGSPEVARWMESIESRLNSLAAQIVAAFTLKQTEVHINTAVFSVAAPAGGPILSFNKATVAGDILNIDVSFSGVSDQVAATSAVATLMIDGNPVTPRSTVTSLVGSPVTGAITTRVTGLAAGTHTIELVVVPAAGSFANIHATGDVGVSIATTTV